MTFRKSFARGEVKLSKTGEIEAAFAQLNVVDLDGDITFPGAFPAKDVPMSAYGHQSWYGALPVGKGTIGEQGEWAIFRGAFFMDTTHGHDAYETVKGLGPLAEYSYGFDIIEATSSTLDGKPVRELRRLDVFEVSPVLRGAGIGTHTLAIKSGAPGTDAPWAERLSWYVDGISGLLDHGKARADMRAAEGRKLSRSDRARLEDLRDALRAHLDEVDDLLVVPEDPKAAALRANAIEVLMGHARTLGVPV